MKILKTASDDGADGTAKPTMPAMDHLQVTIPGEKFVRMLAEAMGLKAPK